VLLAIHYQIIQTSAKLLNIPEKYFSHPWKCVLKRVSPPSPAACKQKIVYIKKLSEKAESSQTSPFSVNFCDTIDSQQVTQILTLKNGQKVIRLLIPCNYLIHNRLQALKRRVIRKGPIFHKPKIIFVSLDVLCYTFFNPHARHSLIPTFYVNKRLSNKIKGL